MAVPVTVHTAPSPPTGATAAAPSPPTGATATIPSSPPGAKTPAPAPPSPSQGQAHHPPLAFRSIAAAQVWCPRRARIQPCTGVVPMHAARARSQSCAGVVAMMLHVHASSHARVWCPCMLHAKHTVLIAHAFISHVTGLHVHSSSHAHVYFHV